VNLVAADGSADTDAADNVAQQPETTGFHDLAC